MDANEPNPQPAANDAHSQPVASEPLLPAQLQQALHARDQELVRLLVDNNALLKAFRRQSAAVAKFGEQVVASSTRLRGIT